MKEKKGKKKLFSNFYIDFVKATGGLPVLLYLRPKIHRPFKTKVPRGGVLVSANHRSYLDPISVYVTFPWRRVHLMATKDLFDTKMKRAFFTRMHCIEVDKDNFSVSAFHDVVDRLKSGKTVGIFPEGRVNRDKDNLLVFKSGAVLMAHTAGAPILPIYIAERDKWYRRQHIVIGEPINVRELVGPVPTLDQLNEVSESLRKMEYSLREYFESLPVFKKISKNYKSETKKVEIKDEENV